MSNDDVTFWAQMSRDFVIEPQENNPYIQKQIRWYQDHPKHLQRILLRARPFIDYVYQQTHYYNLPAELALIPLLESQYNPAIGARSGAAGLWQMMPGTASKFGLRMNHSYDGRRDVTASTKAALSYLSYLYNYFGKNWLLALAAYDAGEGRIASIAGRHSLNFWNLPLSRETRDYVPRLLAIASIIKKPEVYNVSLPQVDKDMVLKELTWKEAKSFNMAEAAKDIGVDDSVLRHFNPGIRKNIADIPGSLTLLVPDSAQQPCIQNQESVQTTRYETRATEEQSQDIDKPVTQDELPPPSITALVKYKVKNHDTLGHIANQFHVSSAALKKINHLKADKLKLGQILTIPASTKKATTTNNHSKKSVSHYTLKQGDNIDAIAKKFHLSTKKLQQVNHLKNTKRLKIGLTITIPSH